MLMNFYTNGVRKHIATKYISCVPAVGTIVKFGATVYRVENVELELDICAYEIQMRVVHKLK